MTVAVKKSAAPDDAALLERAFALAGERGWAGSFWRDLAADSGLPLGELRARFGSRVSLIFALSRRLDAAMLAGDVAELDEMTPRERLFELIMKRLDASQPYKAGLRKLPQAARCEPAIGMATLTGIGQMSDWLLDAAGIAFEGPRRRAASRLLGMLYIRVTAVWLEDDSEDQAKTLAELDKRLSQLEQLAQLGGRMRRRSAA